MKLELGKRYVRRDSNITDWICRSDDPYYPFLDPVNDNTYNEDGKYHECMPCYDYMDLISEYIEPQPVVEDTKPIIDPGEGWRLVIDANELPHRSAQVLSVYNSKPVWENRSYTRYTHGRLYRVPDTVNVIIELTLSPIPYSVITVNSYV